jgi:hypothetical protein
VTDALVLSGLLITAVLLWVAVIAVRFLRSGRKAFQRYLEMTSDPIRPAVPVASRSPWSSESTGGHRRPKWAGK